MKKLRELGPLASVNSDDPGMKRGLYVAREPDCGSHARAIRHSRQNSFRIAWMPPPQRDQWLAAIDAYVADAK